MCADAGESGPQVRIHMDGDVVNRDGDWAFVAAPDVGESGVGWTVVQGGFIELASREIVVGTAWLEEPD
jgi:hypothetical protein